MLIYQSQFFKKQKGIAKKYLKIIAIFIKYIFITMNPVRNSLFVNAKLIQTVVCLLKGSNKDIVGEYRYLTSWSQNLHCSQSLRDCQHKNIFYKASLTVFVSVCESELWASWVILLILQNAWIFYVIMIFLIYSRGRKRSGLVQVHILLTYLWKSQKILANLIHRCHI